MKRGLLLFLKFLLILIAPGVLYLCMGFFGGLIPVNSQWQSKQGELEIYLFKQDMHIDLLLPVHSKIISWDTIFKKEQSLAPPLNPKFIGIGWGDLKFYKNTPEWEDLKVKVAFSALFLKTQSALHTRYYQNIPNAPNLIKIPVSIDQYQKLCQYILESIVFQEKQEIHPIQDLHYHNSDAFYLAKTSFSLLKTCNTWVNSALKTSGLKACLWTPFPHGVFFQYRGGI